tara:strand:- start:4 stop:210 length:207 start_codon:yes stop_codon:yes gene_type:complete
MLRLSTLMQALDYRYSVANLCIKRFIFMKQLRKGLYGGCVVACSAFVLDGVSSERKQRDVKTKPIETK